MPSSDYTAAGYAYLGQGKVTRKPVEPLEIVRLIDLLEYLAGLHQSTTGGITEDELFAGIDQSEATNGHAIYVKSNGRPKNATATEGANKIVFVKQHDKYFPAGKLIKNFSTDLTVGEPYFVSPTGVLSTVPVQSAGEWSIVAGIAINTTDLLVKIENQGQN